MTRKTIDARTAEIEAAMLAEARDSDYRYMTREAVAARVGCSGPLVTMYIGNLDRLRERTVELAVEADDLVIIGQAMAARHPAVRGLRFQTQLLAAAAYLGLPPLAAA